VSIVRNLVKEVRPDPSEGLTLEGFALNLVLAGTPEKEMLALLSARAKKLEAQRAAEWQSREKFAKAAERRQQRIDGAHSVVARLWAVLGWAEHGSPDDSGPLFSVNAPSTPLYSERQRSQLDID
jgi:hypothetical protein